MLSSRNWVVWKEKAAPTSAITGSRKNWNQPQNLASYQQAADFCSANKGYQLGFAFTEGCGFVGLDLDGCRNPATGKIEKWAHAFMGLPSFVNISVSGTGVKLIIRTDEKMHRAVKLMMDVESFGDHLPQVELFTVSKYFAITETELELSETEPPKTLVKDTLEELFGQDLTPDKPIDLPTTGGDTTPAKLREYLSHLNILDYQDRESWFRILQAAHHATGGSEEGLDVFADWSSDDPEQFDREALERDWGSLKPNAPNSVTVATIIQQIPKSERPRAEPEITPEMDYATDVADLRLSSKLNRTDQYIAVQFITKYADLVRYCPQWDKWLVWNGKKWEVDAAGVIVMRLVSEFCRDLGMQITYGLDSDDTKAIETFACIMRSHSKIVAVGKLAKFDNRIYISPKDLDTHSELLNIENGVLNLRTGKLQEHSPDLLMTQIAPIEYREGDDCPVWRKVLSDVFAADGELINYIQALLGYSIFGDPCEEIFPVAYGSGCNGKSTITGIVLSILGDYGTTITSEIFDSKKDLHPTHVAKLFRKRFAAVTEMESDVTLSEAMVKRITSRDAIETRKMREDSWEFLPTHTSWLSTNHKPRVKGQDRGIWRRIKLIPFTVDLTKSQDKSIPVRLELERSGILNWLLTGCQMYLAGGLDNEPAAVTMATSEYRSSEDTLSEFVEDKLIETDDEDQYASAKEVHVEYSMWGGKLGLQNFYKAMEARGHVRERKTKGANRGKRVFTGLKIRSEEL